jgi:DNA-binding MarR family transcriptional regulator
MICRTPVKSNVSKVRTLTLGDPGDLAAPPGSQPWAIAVRLQIQSLLKDNLSSVKHLRTWLKGIEEYAGYRQLTDETGQQFPTYAAFCNAKPPWGLGYPPEVIDQILKELESVQAKQVEQEDKQLKSWGDLEGYLQRFSKLVENCTDNQPINTSKIGEVLDISRSKADVWRKRWLDLGWIVPLPDEKRGYYQITDEGRKFVKDWLENEPSNYINGGLWLTIPRCNSKKAAEQLIKSLEVEQLRELHTLIGESLDEKSDEITEIGD